MTLLTRVVAALSAALFLTIASADVDAPPSPPLKNLSQSPPSSRPGEALVLAPIKLRKPLYQNELRANSCTGTECCCVAGSYGTCYDRTKCEKEVGKCGEAPGC
jgi:hypothetical protein